MRVTFASRPGSPDRPNLDWIGCTNELVVVLDGLSEEETTGCEHGTRWFVHQLGARLLLHLGDERVTPAEGLAEAIEDVVLIHRGTCDLSHPASPSTTVAIVRQQEDELDYLILSDAAVVLARADADPVAIVDDTVKAVTDHLVREAAGDLATFLSLQQRYRNTADGYWVAQVDPGAAERALTGTATGVTGAVVASDGGALLVTEFGQLDWRSYLDLAFRQGPAGIIAATRRAELDDPDCKRWPRYKTHDDATVAICRL